MSDDVVEAMARGIAEAMGHTWETLSNLGRAGMCDLARAAIRAVTARGGLVVGKMPGRMDRRAGDGWDDALAAVRAAAVEVEP